MPNQCGRCRGHDHLVRNCPKKYPPVRKKEAPPKPKIAEDMSELHQTPEPAATQEPEETPAAKEDQDQDQEHDQLPHSSSSQEESVNAAVAVSSKQDNPTTQDVVKQVPGSRSEIGEACQCPASPSKEVLHTPAKSAKHGESVRTAELKLGTLQPDDFNFPKLQTPSSAKWRTPRTQTADSPRSQATPFVWSSQQVVTPHKTEGHKGKGRILDSTPLTRQGYRTGRLAEDFWSSISMPNTPTANSKMLRVIPFLTKNRHLE